MILTISVIGKPGSGKTRLIGFLIAMLEWTHSPFRLVDRSETYTTANAKVITLIVELRG